MALTLNMVGGGSGGGMSATDAILRVQAPANSVVTISKGGVSKSDNGHENADNNTIYEYFFIIHQSQFDSVNAWTVTATRGTDTNSKTIIVNTSDEYYVAIGYHVPIDIYQEVEYLQSTGTQLIDTSLSNVDGIDIDFQLTDVSSDQAVYGVRNAWSNTNAFAMTVYLNKFWYLPVPSDSYSQYMVGTDTLSHNFKYGSYNNWEANFDGTTLHTYSSQAVSANNMRLFCEYVSNAGNANFSNCKIFHVAFYVGSTLSRDFYPCYRLSDSVAGMYDKVNGVFYTNAGSGTFIVGGNVS